MCGLHAHIFNKGSHKRQWLVVMEGLVCCVEAVAAEAPNQVTEVGLGLVDGKGVVMVEKVDAWAGSSVGTPR